LANNKAQTKVLPPAKNNEKAAQDKKSQVATAKVKKSPAQATQSKKRRFTFFSDIINELRKVVWPTRQETVRLSLIVIGLCLAVGLFLGLLDYGFSELVAKVFLGGK
jgi:preprotein translocase subunit SecE